MSPTLPPLQGTKLFKNEERNLIVTLFSFKIDLADSF